MVERKRYYSSSSCSGHLDAGKELDLRRCTYYRASKGALSQLVQLPLGALEAMRDASVEKEKAIYNQLCEATEEWETQAQETGRLDAAVEYLQTPAVTHTANKWAEDQYGRHEISNMVYAMSWRVYEQTRWSNTAKKSIPVAWELSWSVSFNVPHNPHYSGGGRHIAGQERKRFTDKAGMEKYLQGRIVAYEHLFTQHSPPIPEEHQGRFCVSGELLPGYTVEAHTPTVAELLDLLGDEDMPATEAEPLPETTKKVTDTQPLKFRHRHR